MSFDRIARYYQTLESIAAGSQMQRARLALLEHIPVPRRVLLAAEGHGRFLLECVRRFPDA